MRIQAEGTLLLHHTVYPGPPDLADNVGAFKRHSRFPVFPVNTALGFPDGLNRLRFRVIVLHYTVGWGGFEALGEHFREYLANCRDSLKIAFFQDEQSHLPQRLSFCSDYSIDCVYTCLGPPDSDFVYRSAGASTVISCLPGYVSARLRTTASGLEPKRQRRPIDIGYRGRRSPTSWEGAATEKYEIAGAFKRRAQGLGLVLDIETDESKRMYGQAWPRFIASCKAMLGTESGATIPDPSGMRQGGIPYRTISPRHFEAAALRTCQILYPGRYSGILEPMVHYIPLEKDFSNFDEVIARFHNSKLRRELTEAAFSDLIASNRFSYETFLRQFDEQLAAVGLRPGTPEETNRVATVLYPRHWRRWARNFRQASRIGVRIAVNKARGRPVTDALRSPTRSN